MNGFRLITGLGMVVLASASAAAAGGHVMLQPDSLKWTDAPPILPKGAQIATLYGDPGKPDRSFSGSNSPPATRWRRTSTPTTTT